MGTRAEAMTRMREAGASFERIGEAFGRSGERVRQIFHSRERLLHMECLNVRATNILRMHLGKDEFEPRDVAALTPDEMKTLPGMNAKCLIEILAYLQFHGLNKNA
jgi:hypothetical protein